MSSDTDSLLEFIAAAKAQGASDDFLVAMLRQNGWSERRIYQAFGIWYQQRAGIAVPSGGGRIEAAKDAFFYLISFITLGIWSFQLCALLFTAIDRSFPNPSLGINNSDWELRSMADQLASVIVAFPLFLLVARSIIRGVREQPERLESSVRKWLTYLALVVTASIMIGDVVTFLAYFLRGDLSTRFLLKVITVLVVAGGIFAYYLDSLRREAVASGRNRLFAIAAGVAVTLGVIVGFSAVGSPSAQNLASQDARRLADLSSLALGCQPEMDDQKGLACYDSGTTICKSWLSEHFRPGEWASVHVHVARWRIVPFMCELCETQPILYSSTMAPCRRLRVFQS